jgi:hypothetical protein
VIDMSRARQLASKVRTKGEAARGTWKPDPTGATFKRYQYWLEVTGAEIPRENLCHYWRVVVIWVTWHRHGRTIKRALLGLLGLAVLALLVWLFVLWTDVMSGLVIGLVGFLYLVSGVFVGSQVLAEVLEDEGFDTKEPWSDWTTSMKALATLLTLPVLIVCGVFLLVVVTLLVFFMSLHEDYDLYGKIGRWLAQTKPGEHKLVAWLRPWELSPLALVLFATQWAWAQVFLIVVGAFAVLFGIVIGLAFLSDMHKEKKRRLRDERYERIRRNEIDTLLSDIFSALHPQSAHYEAAYRKWRMRYHDWCLQKGLDDEYDAGVPWHLDKLSRKAYWRYNDIVRRRIDAMMARPDEVPYQPGAFVRFIGWSTNHAWDFVEACIDFLSLFWAWLVARKWRICPWVELPDTSS